MLTFRAKVNIAMTRMRGNSRMLAVANRVAAARACATFSRASEAKDPLGALDAGATPAGWELGMASTYLARRWPGPPCAPCMYNLRWLSK